MPDSIRLNVEVSKIDEEQHLVFGIISVVEIDGTPVIDKQGDAIAVADIEKSAYDFTLWGGVGGNMHSRVGISRLVESMVFTSEKQTALVAALQKRGIDASMNLHCVLWWGGFKVDDQQTWNDVKAGKVPQLSIGGKGKRKPLGS